MDDCTVTAPQKPLKDRLDIRIVSLYSRDTQNMPHVGKLTEKNQYYTYSYYDAIWVEPAEVDEDTMLQGAYKQAVSLNRAGRPNMFQQFFIVFADIESSDIREYKGYSAQHIADFWSDNSFPLFFMTMLNVKEPSHLSQTLKLIQEIFPAKHHLAYLTFDHSNIVIFARSNSFQAYAKSIFQLDYGHPDMITDSITLYTFAPNSQADADNEPQEEFPALVSIGVSDYQAFEEFEKNITNQDKDIQFFWMLGRNDVGVYHPRATIPWLKSIKRTMESSPNWYTTYDLSILIRQSEIQPGSNSKKTTKSMSIQEKMKSAYQKFSLSYKNKCREMKTAPDEVWLRWLRESSQLSASLAESLLSLDLGTCLAPQFFDFFTYAQKLFGSEDLESFQMGEVNQSFSEFYYNISVLIDSMNHSNRQFVQVPSFHSVAFEIPPRLMAYYTAMAHAIIEVLHDDSADYGLTIAPKYVNELEVSSIAVTGVQGIEEEEFISMSIDEQSLYTLQLTTEAMAHEISHFVGREGRCREFRKECIIKCTLHGILSDLTNYIARDILVQCPSQDCVYTVPFDICHDHLKDCVKEIWDTMISLPEFCLETNNYGDQVQELIYNLPDILSATPELNAEIVKQVTRLLFNNKDVEKYILRYVAYEAGATNDVNSIEVLTACWRKTAEYKIQCSVQDVLDGYALELQKLTQETPQEEHNTKFGKTYKFRRLYESFRETFADLQAILIFNISWPMYCRLLKRKNESFAELKDIPNRVVAVGRVLVQTGFWKKEDICAEDTELEPLVQAILDTQCSSKNLEQLNQGLSYTLLSYLELYLKQCYFSLKQVLDNPERKQLIVELQEIHTALSNENSALNLCTKLMEFINSYRNSLRSERPG